MRKNLLLVMLTFVLGACGGGGGGEAISPADGTNIKAPDSLYTGSRNIIASLDESSVQEILYNYYATSMLLNWYVDEGASSSQFSSIFIDTGQSNIMDEQDCISGGKVSLTAIQTDSQHQFQFDFTNCNESGSVLHGTVTYQLARDTTNRLDIFFNQLRIDDVTLNGEMHTTEWIASAEEAAIDANIIISSPERQLYLENMTISRNRTPIYNQPAPPSKNKGKLYISNLGYVEIISDDYLYFESNENIENPYPYYSSPIIIQGENGDTAEVEANGSYYGSITVVDHEVFDIKLENQNSNTPRYLRVNRDEYFNLDFTKPNTVAPVAEPYSIPVYDYANPNDLPVLIDGRGSYDADNNFLAYSWELIQQANYSDSSYLENTDQAIVSLHPTLYGTYKLGLKVFDGTHWSEQKVFDVVYGDDTRTWNLSVEYKDPFDPIDPYSELYYLYDGIPVLLHASVRSSSHPLYDLSYQWNIKSAPVGSIATIDETSSEDLIFTPDVPGTYQLEITVTDKFGTSTTFIHQLHISDRSVLKPNVYVEGSRLAVLGESFSLDASTSRSTFGPPPVTSYQWEIISTPNGSALSGTSSTNAVFNFTPDQAGTYKIATKVATVDYASDEAIIVCYVTDDNTHSAPHGLNLTAAIQKYQPGSRQLISLAGDLNNDGMTDILLIEMIYTNSAISKTYQIHQILQDASGGFIDSASSILSDPNSEIHDFLEVIDFNNDGTAELLVSDINGLKLYSIQSGGELTLSGTVVFENYPGSVSHIIDKPVFADINADGKIDMLWKRYLFDQANPFDNRIMLSYSIQATGNNLLGPMQDLYLPNGSKGYHVPIVTKPSNNGIGDEIVLLIREKQLVNSVDTNSPTEREVSSLIHIAYQNSGLAIIDQIDISHVSGLTDYHKAEMVDLDNDGYLDLITGISIFQNIEQGNPIQTTLFDNHVYSSDSYYALDYNDEIIFTDLNNDGITDIFTSNYILLIDQENKFNQIHYLPDSLRTGYKLADLDNDSKPDIFRAIYSSSSSDEIDITTWRNILN